MLKASRSCRPIKSVLKSREFTKRKDLQRLEELRISFLWKNIGVFTREEIRLAMFSSDAPVQMSPAEVLSLWSLHGYQSG